MNKKEQPGMTDDDKTQPQAMEPVPVEAAVPAADDAPPPAPAPATTRSKPVRQISVMQAALKARRQLQQITGLDVATVSAVERHEGGWRAYVNLVELRRVPTTSDVLATYEATLDSTGELVTYRRLRRFLRGQVGE